MGLTSQAFGLPHVAVYSKAFGSLFHLRHTSTEQQMLIDLVKRCNPNIAFDAYAHIAEEIVREEFGDKRRKSGNLVVEEHIYPITTNVCLYRGTRATGRSFSVAMLHDAIEDGAISEKDLRSLYQGQLVTGTVDDIVRLTRVDPADYLWREVRKQDPKVASRIAYQLYAQHLGEVEDPFTVAPEVKVFDKINNLFSAHALPEPKYLACIEEAEQCILPIAFNLDQTFGSNLVSVMLQGIRYAEIRGTQEKGYRRPPRIIYTPQEARDEYRRKLSTPQELFFTAVSN